jgi:PST family polysaccharide transporter
MQAIALYCLSISIAFNAGDIFKAQGRLWILTVISAGKLVILVPALWWAVALPLGNPMLNIVVVGMVQAVVAILSDVVNLYVVSRALGASLREVVQALTPSFAGGALMSLTTWLTLTALQTASPLMQLALSVSVGGLTYLGSMWWLQRELALLAWKKVRQFTEKVRPAA